MWEKQSIERELESIKTELEKLKRRIKDALTNLDEENMPTLWRKIRKHNNRTDSTLASLELSAAEQAGQLAALQMAADAQGAKIALVVESGQIKGAAIIAAINGQSVATIEADRINFTGFATFVRPGDLSAGGTTVIDGGRIAAGTLSTDRLTKNEDFAVEFGSDIWTEHAILFSDGYDLVGHIRAGEGSSVVINALGGLYANDGLVISDAYINGYIDARLAHHNLI